MTNSTHIVLCGTCRVEVEGPTEPYPDARYACPVCGNSDTFDNVSASCNAFAEEFLGNKLQESLVKSMRGSDFIEVTAQPINNGPYPFILYMEL